MNPSDDTFVSVSRNAELKVYDLCSEYSSPEAELDIKETGYQLCANFDITGVVLAVSVFKREGDRCFNRIDLYDVKKYQDEECRFDNWRIDSVPQIHQIKFSNSGEYMLLGTVQNKVIVLDAYEGRLLAEFGGFLNQVETAVPAGKMVHAGLEADHRGQRRRHDIRLGHREAHRGLQARRTHQAEQVRQVLAHTRDDGFRLPERALLDTKVFGVTHNF